MSTKSVSVLGSTGSVLLEQLRVVALSTSATWIYWNN